MFELSIQCYFQALKLHESGLVNHEIMARHVSFAHINDEKVSLLLIQSSHTVVSLGTLNFMGELIHEFKYLHIKMFIKI